MRVRVHGPAEFREKGGLPASISKSAFSREASYGAKKWRIIHTSWFRWRGFVGPYLRGIDTACGVGEHGSGGSYCIAENKRFW